MRAQSVTPVASFDDTKMTGTWYEIARLPNKYEKNCAANPLELVALNDKPRQLQLVDSCKSAKGFVDPRNLIAKANKKTHDGAYKISRLVIFSRKYWWLAIAPLNDWALIGSPDHKELWIFARTPTMDPEALTDVRAKAAAMGFAVDRMVMAKQLCKGTVCGE